MCGFTAQLDCSQPSIFSYFFLIIEPAVGIMRELDASAKGRLDWLGGEDFLVSPGTENSHWFKGGKNAITLTTADHDCMQECLAACRSCHH